MNARLNLSLLLIIYSSVFGWLVDLDHVLVLVQKGLPITTVNLLTQAGRPAHWPAFFVSISLCCLTGAYYFRFLFNLARSSRLAVEPVRIDGRQTAVRRQP